MVKKLVEQYWALGAKSTVVWFITGVLPKVKYKLLYTKIILDVGCKVPKNLMVGSESKHS